MTSSSSSTETTRMGSTYVPVETRSRFPLLSGSPAQSPAAYVLADFVTWLLPGFIFPAIFASEYVGDIRGHQMTDLSYPRKSLPFSLPTSGLRRPPYSRLAQQYVRVSGHKPYITQLRRDLARRSWPNSPLKVFLSFAYVLTCQDNDQRTHALPTLQASLIRPYAQASIIANVCNLFQTMSAGFLLVDVPDYLEWVK